MNWDLYQQRPILLYHPLGQEVRIAAVLPKKGGVIWLNLESIIKKLRLGMSSDFDSFILNTVDGSLCFVEEKNEWHIRDSNGHLYRFAPPIRNTLELWNQYNLDVTLEIENIKKNMIVKIS